MSLPDELRALSDGHDDGPNSTCRRAAKRIETLESALRPFACAYADEYAQLREGNIDLLAPHNPCNDYRAAWVVLYGKPARDIPSDSVIPGGESRPEIGG